MVELILKISNYSNNPGGWHEQQIMRKKSQIKETAESYRQWCSDASQEKQKNTQFVRKNKIIEMLSMAWKSYSWHLVYYDEDFNKKFGFSKKFLIAVAQKNFLRGAGKIQTNILGGLEPKFPNDNACWVLMNVIEKTTIYLTWNSHIFCVTFN